ncbi:MAG TPA: RHS repeat-associated core domain-containing protein [Paenibacillus cookii]|nr:RHS repeat-associated core domain-containing protein [Paenibacillus cookii]
MGYGYTDGLTYARARYYQPEIGRFISEDTYEGQIHEPLSLNRYTYVY